MLTEYLQLRHEIFLAVCLKKRENIGPKHGKVSSTIEKLLHYLCYIYVQ